MANDKHSSVAGYIIVALILGVITYVEFAIVEHPQEWLGRGWTLFWLIALSIVKFVMVVMYFMHLKDDDSTYTGFFSSGMFISLATFVGMTAMFILPRAVVSTSPENVVAGAASHHVPPEVLELVESDGRSRTPAEQADSPRPADRSVTITPPQAGNDASSYQLNLPEPLVPATPEADDAAAAADTAAEAADGATTALEEAAQAVTDAVESAAEAVADTTETVVDAVEYAAQTAAEAVTDTAEAAGAAAAAAVEAVTTPAAEETAADSEPVTVTALVWDREAGESVYSRNCVACHQASGQGIPGAFPPLADHANHIYEDGGREFLLDVVLFGMQGAIQVNGMNYNGLMQSWAHFSDADVANVLNYVLTAWNDDPANFVPYQPSDVAAQRDRGLSPTDVHALRGELGF